MPRASTSVAVAAVGVAAILNLASASVAPQAVQLGCSAPASGKTFNIFGTLDSAATASSPNLAPLVTGWSAPGSATLPVDVDWPILVFVQTTTGAAGTLYGSAEASALPTAPTSTALPAVGAFLAAPIACPGGKTRVMLDAAATASDSVLVYTTENSVANSATSCTCVATLTGAGSFVDVESGYVQIKTVAKPAATSVKVAGIVDAGGLAGGVASSVVNAGAANVTGGTGATITATTGIAALTAPDAAGIAALVSGTAEEADQIAAWWDENAPTAASEVRIADFIEREGSGTRALRALADNYAAVAADSGAAGDRQLADLLERFAREFGEIEALNVGGML